MRFMIDAMLPPHITEALNSAGHDSVTPAMLGAHNLPDEALIQLASVEGRTIVTENARDFSHVTVCPVRLVRKAWWPIGTVAARLQVAVQEWAMLNPEPGAWSHWLPSDLR